MTTRHLLALAACLISTSQLQAENLNLNWANRKIQLTVQRKNSDAAIPTGISVRRGTNEMAVVCDDHLVRIKDKRNGKLIRIFETHSDWIKIAVFTPNGQQLFTAGSDHAIISWNPENEHDFRRFAKEDRAIEGLTIDNNGEFLATVGFNNKLNIYDISARKLVRTVECPCNDMRSIAISPNNDLIAVGGRSGMLRVFNLKNGTKICDIQSHKKRIRDLVFINQNSIVSCSDDMTVMKADILSQKSSLVIRENTKFYSLAHLGGDQVAVGSSDNLIRILDTRQNVEIGSLKGHKGTVCELVVDGDELISGSFDTQIRIWEIDDNFVSVPAVRVSQKPNNSFRAPSANTQQTFQPKSSFVVPSAGKKAPEAKAVNFSSGFQIGK